MLLIAGLRVKGEPEMRVDSRLSRMLHVLLHMARASGPMTSEQIANMLGTNAALIRRTMAGLREAGYVLSDKGHGGGWTLTRDIDTFTILDVHKAVGGGLQFAIGFDNVSPDCLVEKVVNAAMGEALGDAEAILLQRFGEVTLGQLARRFDDEARFHTL